MSRPRGPLRSVLTWVALACAIGAPLGIAATSPLTAWRDPIYIGASLAGVAGMALLLLQPLLIMNALPLPPRRARQWHRWAGGGLLVAVVLHVAGLWVTSPPDVVDVLLLRSPTPFAIWGLLAMWAVVATALWAVMRRRLKLSPRLWRSVHLALAFVVLGGTIVHALLIEGMMGPLSKLVLSALIGAACVALVCRQRF